MTDKRYQANIITKTKVDPTSNLESGAAPGVWSLSEAAKYTEAGVWPTAGNVAVDTDEVFSTYMYTGNGTGQNIDNSLNLGQSYGSGGGDFALNGDNDNESGYLSIASTTDFGFGTGDFTVEMFVYPRTQSGFSGFFSTMEIPSGDNPPASNTGLVLGTYNTGGLNYDFNSASGGEDKGTTLTIGQWSHVALTRSGTAVTLWVNGTSVSTESNSDDLGSSQRGVIGRYYANYNGFGYDGYLSNVRVVKGTALYTSSFTPPTSNLTAVSGTVLLALQGDAPFTDNSSSAHTLTPTSPVLETEFGPFDAATAGDGGLVWLKNRTTGGSGYEHSFIDSERGVDKWLTSNSTNQEVGISSWNISFNKSGWSLDVNNSYANTNTNKYASWAFKKADKFFTSVTYTGNGAARAISHDLNSDVGMLIVKSRSGTGPWRVWMRGFTGTQRMELNSTDGLTTTNTGWDGKTPTDTEFYVGADTNTNNNGTTYIAYLFAHNATGSFGPDQDLPMVKVGSYTGSGSIQDIDIGMEPSWIMLKNVTDSGNNWEMGDIFRGLPQSSNTSQGFFLRANSNGAEFTNYSWGPLPNGFRMYNTGGGTNANGKTYYYMAIGRPTRKPTDPNLVFDVQKNFLSAYSKALFPVDMVIGRSSLQQDNWRNFNRMFGTQYIETNTTTASSHLPAGEVKWDSNRGFYQETDGTPNIWYQWRRAPHFFDMVWYKGTGSARTISHGLQQAPKMMWVRKLSGANDWKTYHASAGADYSMELNTTLALQNDGNVLWNSTDPTDSVFSVGSVGDVNQSGQSYICYLFGEVAGISKIGTLTGTGSDQTIDCGFTNGARWVMWKQTDSANSWGVTDVISGYTASSTNYFLLNSDAQRASATLIKPDSSGFIFGSAFSSGSYIFYAIA